MNELKDKIINKLENLNFDCYEENKAESLRDSFIEFIDNYYNKNSEVRKGSCSREFENAFSIVEKSEIVVFDWTIGPNDSANFVSDNIEQFGYTPDDFYFGELKDYWNFVHPDDRAFIKKSVYEVRKSNVSDYKHSYRIVTKSGEVRWIEERIVFDRDDKNNLIHEKGIIIDITETKKLQMEVKRSEEKFKRIFENSSVIIITLTRNGIISAANKMFEKTIGYSKHEIIGTKAYKLLDQDSYEEEISRVPILENIYANHEENFDIYVKCKNGQVKMFNISGNIIDSYEEQIEIVAVDITEQKIVEKKIRYLSYHDKLTDVHNRAFYDETLNQLVENKKYPFSIIIGDMNGLKEINDKCGHKEGDELLKGMATIFSSSSRDDDIVCRIGGDEFAIICPNVSEEVAEKICNRIRESCDNYCDTYGNAPSVALGFATKYSDADNLERIIKLADDNMYRNKMNITKSARGMFIKTMQSMIEENSLESKEHTLRVNKLAEGIGASLNLNSAVVDELCVVALLHDIGNVGVPSNIISKADVLTNEEYEIVKNHSLIGYNILTTSTTTEDLAKYVLHHHERFDGTGYPHGLEGEEIPLISRIISVIDSYDVMLQGRAYRKSKTKELAIAELITCSGTQFDPDIVDAFIEYLRSVS